MYPHYTRYKFAGAHKLPNKGECKELKQTDKAFNALFSTAVSKVRQPIEAFFNWLNEKTTIQRAMKVGSANRLLVHIFGKLAIAFLYLIF